VQSLRDQQAGERNVSATEQDLTENEARRQILVRAPSAGTVTAITAVVLDTRRLNEWILEPLYTITATFEPPTGPRRGTTLIHDNGTDHLSGADRQCCGI